MIVIGLSMTQPTTGGTSLDPPGYIRLRGKQDDGSTVQLTGKTGDTTFNTLLGKFIP
jgi:hypothetical protein